MLKFLSFLIIVTLPVQAGWFSKQAHHPRYHPLQEGDIVFQDTGGQQGEAVRAATKSPFTHCGVVFEDEGALYVLEAVQPVQVTTLAAWKKRSTVFHARRLKDRSRLDATALNKALKWGTAQIGKDYDLHFRWGDDQLYCSELVWKIYHKSTGLSLCEPKTFQSYFLNDPIVREVVRKRYGDLSRLPKNEPVVAPSDLASSGLLAEVPRQRKKR
ncbi:YiiX/YebB-like N1pC/P60 family cysteine hydrolase [Verrucomicrobiaceae bacterium 227]